MLGLKDWCRTVFRGKGIFYYTKMFFDFLKSLRKQAIYAESRELIALNRQIHMTDYSKFLYSQKEDRETRRIIVSFTTHRDRIDYVHYLLDSLFFQTLRPSEVRLYIAQGEYKQMPRILDRFKPWLKIIETEDIGSFKKYIPALKDLGGGESYLISLDDDLMVGPHFISRLVRLKDQYPNAMVGYIGSKNKKGVTIGLAGPTGILWDLKTFDIKKHPFFFQKELFIDAMGIKNNDDPWLSFSANALGVEMHCLSDDFFTTYRKDFIPLPSEKMHALTASASELNIAKKSIMIESRVKKIIQEAIKREQLS